MRRVWLVVALCAIVVIPGGVVAAAAVTGKVHHKTTHNVVICRPDGRRTIKSHGYYYIVRNDVFFPERECIQLERPGPGFIVIRSHAHSHGADNEAFPEVIYGCAWGLCTPHTLLPKRIYRLKNVDTSWGASWHKSPGRFNVAYDIWFGHLHTIHGHALGAEMMIWIGTKRFGIPIGAPTYLIDGQRWYYGRHTACDIYGCWNYILFRRVNPSTHATHLGLLPFIHFAQAHRQLAWWWFLKSIDVGFEIWWGGQGLAVHSYSVHIKLRPVVHKKR